MLHQDSLLYRSHLITWDMCETVNYDLCFSTQWNKQFKEITFKAVTG